MSLHQLPSSKKSSSLPRAGRLKNQPRGNCAVCFDNVVATKGFTCPKHCATFTCWDCLQESYVAASRPGAAQGSINSEGELLCSNTKCRCPITVAELSKRHASEMVLKAQESFKIQFLTTKRIVEALRQQEAQIRGEYARIEQIKDADEKAAVKLRLKIIDQALTLRCPRCKAAFIDFDGCFAVNCANNTCGCGFCAWCLSDCGENAHQHVLTCPENRGDDYFDTLESFAQHHKQKRITAVQKLLREASLNRRATQKLRELMQMDLKDLQISVKDVFSTVSGSSVSMTSSARLPLLQPGQPRTFKRTKKMKKMKKMKKSAQKPKSPQAPRPPWRI